MSFFKKFIQKTFLPTKSIEETKNTLDSYVESCFSFDFQELGDERNWNQIPEAIAIAEAGNTGSIAKAIELAEALQEKLIDFDFSYSWLGNLYLMQERYDDALNVVTKGLNLAKSKYELCDQMAMIYFKQGKISEATKWWIICTVIQVKSKKFGIQNWVYLSEIADALELSEASLKLKQYSDDTQLSGNAKNHLNFITIRNGTESMKVAINLLVSKYLSPQQELIELCKDGLLCDSCSTRFTIDEVIKPSSRDGKHVVFTCPKCQVNCFYNTNP